MVRTQLIEDNVDLVAKIARKYRVRDHDELISVGHVAIINAFDTYDETKGNFRSWAAKKIRFAIIDHFRSTLISRPRRIMVWS